MNIRRIFEGVVTAVVVIALGPAVQSQTDVRVGYAAAITESGSPAPVGSVLFTYTNTGGIVVSEAAVGAASPTLRGRIFVDEAGVRTAIALVNPSSDPAAATFVLRDISGNVIDRRNVPLAGKEHQSLFVSE